MSTKRPKSFRFNSFDILKLQEVHKYYKNNYREHLDNTNMEDLYRWSEAQTVAMLIRNRYDELVKSGKISEIDFNAVKLPEYLDIKKDKE